MNLIDVAGLVKLKLRPEVLEPEEVGVEAAASILSPPGLAIVALPKRPSSGPYISTEPRSLEHF